MNSQNACSHFVYAAIHTNDSVSTTNKQARWHSMPYNLATDIVVKYIINKALHGKLRHRWKHNISHIRPRVGVMTDISALNVRYSNAPLPTSPSYMDVISRH
jgi:hypothetical protein